MRKSKQKCAGVVMSDRHVPVMLESMLSASRYDVWMEELVAEAYLWAAEKKSQLESAPRRTRKNTNEARWDWLIVKLQPLDMTAGALSEFAFTPVKVITSSYLGSIRSTLWRRAETREWYWSVKKVDGAVVIKKTGACGRVKADRDAKLTIDSIPLHLFE